MSITYRLLKAVFRRTVPTAAKEFFFDGRTSFSRAILTVKNKMEGTASHADVYDAVYYANYSDEMEQSTIGIAESMIKHLNPHSIVDIGCGSGEVLSEFAKRGIQACGADFSPAALAICRNKGLTVCSLDIEDVHSLPNWRADVALSIEVAEHLPAGLADHYAGVLTAIAQKAILITAAPPGQGGTDHVNEQPKAYWIEKFKSVGAVFDRDLTSEFQQAWNEFGVERTRTRNVMVFLKDPSSADE